MLVVFRSATAMSQLDSRIQFWKATGGYLCVAKLKNQWFYVGCSSGEYQRFLADCKRWGMVLVSVCKPCPVRELFRRHGSLASALKDHLPHYDIGNGNRNGERVAGFLRQQVVEDFV